MRKTLSQIEQDRLVHHDPIEPTHTNQNLVTDQVPVGQTPPGINPTTFRVQLEFPLTKHAITAWNQFLDEIMEPMGLEKETPQTNRTIRIILTAAFATTDLRYIPRLLGISRSEATRTIFALRRNRVITQYPNDDQTELRNLLMDDHGGVALMLLVNVATDEVTATKTETGWTWQLTKPGIQRVEVTTRISYQETSKNPAAVTLGKAGGLKGGPARAQRLTPERRSQIAREAALKRWNKSKFPPGKPNTPEPPTTNPDTT